METEGWPSPALRHSPKKVSDSPPEGGSSDKIKSVCPLLWDRGADEMVVAAESIPLVLRPVHRN